MKYSIALVAAGASFVIAQAPADLPACGQLCINNMIGIASTEFGCSAGDVACYCREQNFGYGIRDCSNAVCSPEEAARVISYGTEYCAGAVPSDGDAPATDALTASAETTGTDSPTNTEATPTGSDSEGGASTAVSTSALVATITSGDQTITTTTGFSTIYGDASGSATDGATGTEATGDATATATDAESSASDAAESGASDASDAANSAADSATSTGAAPIQTAVPLLGAAGIAAMLFI